MRRILSVIIFSVISLVSYAQEVTVRDFANKMGQSIMYLGSFYLDTVNFTNITDKAMEAIVKELDPHSMYISAKDVKAMNEPLKGNFSGIGVEFAIINDTLTIQSTIPGGPSEKVGIKAGDKIIKVENDTVASVNLTIEKVHKYLRGEKGTKVRVFIKRKDVSGLLEFLITRDNIPLNSIDSYYKTPENLLYVRLTRFSATSFKELVTILEETKGDFNGVILDLRNNPGGYLGTAIEIANEFLHKGQLIVYTKGRTVPMMKEYANGYGSLKDTPVAVLIDEGSASASEIVSGAIQDWDAGVIIGRRSFGKGLVQRMFPLPDGSEIRLTVAQYHTPCGRVIQSPYKQGHREDYFKNLIERYSSGEMFSKDSIAFPDSLKYQTIVKKRTVYGGGGIMPDIFIPQDTSFYTPFYGELNRKSIITDFANNYSDANRDKLLKKYPHYKDFVAKFNIDKELFSQFLSYAETHNVKPKEGDLDISSQEIKKYLKGLIIRSLYGFSHFVEFINQTDRDVLEARRVLGTKKG